MKIFKAITASTLLILGTSMFSVASARVINFDDIYVPPPPVTGRNAVPLANGYEGFNWSGGRGGKSWIIAHNGDGWAQGVPAPSGENQVWNNGGTNLSMSGIAGAQFNLDSFLGRDYNNRPVILRGFLGGTEIATQTLKFTTKFQKFDINMRGVDKVTWTSPMNIVMDDITVNSISAVPEPETYAMMLAGLGLIGFMARRRRQA